MFREKYLVFQEKSRGTEKIPDAPYRLADKSSISEDIDKELLRIQEVDRKAVEQCKSEMPENVVIESLRRDFHQSKEATISQSKADQIIPKLEDVALKMHDKLIIKYPELLELHKNVMGFYKEISNELKSFSGKSKEDKMLLEKVLYVQFRKIEGSIGSLFDGARLSIQKSGDAQSLAEFELYADAVEGMFGVKGMVYGLNLV